jgi:hypothetical protein
VSGREVSDSIDMSDLSLSDLVELAEVEPAR